MQFREDGQREGSYPRSHEFDHDPPLCTSRGSHLDYSPGVQGSRYAYPHVCSNNWEAIHVPRNNPPAWHDPLEIQSTSRPTDRTDKDLRRLFVARDPEIVLRSRVGFC